MSPDTVALASIFSGQANINQVKTLNFKQVESINYYDEDTAPYNECEFSCVIEASNEDESKFNSASVK